MEETEDNGHPSKSRNRHQRQAIIDSSVEEEGELRWTNHACGRTQSSSSSNPADCGDVKESKGGAPCAMEGGVAQRLVDGGIHEEEAPPLLGCDPSCDCTGNEGLSSKKKVHIPGHDTEEPQQAHQLQPSTFQLQNDRRRSLQSQAAASVAEMQQRFQSLLNALGEEHNMQIQELAGVIKPTTLNVDTSRRKSHPSSLSNSRSSVDNDSLPNNDFAARRKSEYSLSRSNTGATLRGRSSIAPLMDATMSNSSLHTCPDDQVQFCAATSWVNSGGFTGIDGVDGNRLHTLINGPTFRPFHRSDDGPDVELGLKEEQDGTLPVRREKKQPFKGKRFSMSPFGNPMVEAIEAINGFDDEIEIDTVLENMDVKSPKVNDRHKTVRLKSQEVWKMAAQEQDYVAPEASTLTHILNQSHKSNVAAGAYSKIVTVRRQTAARQHPERHQVKSPMCKPIILHPSGVPRGTWDALGMGFLLIDVIMVPLFAFEGVSTSSFVEKFGVASSVYWLLDIFFSFSTGYHNKGVVEMRMPRIVRRYMKTWMSVDLMLVGGDWMFILMNNEGQSLSFFRIGRSVSRGMRVLRLVRIVKVQGVLATFTERVRTEHGRTVFNILGLVTFIVILNHFIACGWYALGNLMTGVYKSRSWVNKNLVDEDDLWYRYWTSLHWSLTQFTPASMEVVPANAPERCYTVIVLLFALVGFSSFVSSITQSMTHLRQINSKRLAQEVLLRRYLHQHSISGKLINRVWHYLHQQEVKNSITLRTKEQDVIVMQLLPKNLVNELRFEAYMPTLVTHPFFYHYGLLEPGALVQLCQSGISEISLLPKQELFGDRDLDVETTLKMVFVEEGELTYKLPCQCKEHAPEPEEASLGLPQKRMAKSIAKFATQNSVHSIQSVASVTVVPTEDAPVEPHTDVIKAGSWACEAALWATEVDLASPFVALSKAEVLLLHPTEFQNVVLQYPQSRKHVGMYAENFTELIGHMTACRWRTVICNEYSYVQDITHRVFDHYDAWQRGQRTGTRITNLLASWNGWSSSRPLGTRLRSLFRGGDSNGHKNFSGIQPWIGSSVGSIENGRYNSPRRGSAPSNRSSAKSCRESAALSISAASSLHGRYSSTDSMDEPS